MVPRAEFQSYYGRPIVRPPSWKAHNIAGYFFLGGLAAGSSLLAAAGDLTARPVLRRVGRLAAGVALGGSLVALIGDLGRPRRFLNMLRVFRPTSPMNMGSWILAAYGPLATAAATIEVLTGGPASSRVAGRKDMIGRVAGLGAAALAPGLASYTAVILADTAIPLWHESRRELPFIFVGSAASAAGGLAMAVTPMNEASPGRWLAATGAALEIGAEWRLEKRLGMVGEPLKVDNAGLLLKLSRVLGGAGVALGCAFGGRFRPAAVAGGLFLLLGSACARFSLFYAGLASSHDPRFTIVPQRDHLKGR